MRASPRATPSSARPRVKLPKTGPKSFWRIEEDAFRELSEDTIIQVSDVDIPTESPLKLHAGEKPVVPIPRFEEQAVSTPPLKGLSIRRSERIMDNRDSPFIQSCEAEILKARRYGDVYQPRKDRDHAVHCDAQADDSDDAYVDEVFFLIFFWSFRNAVASKLERD